MSPVLDVRPGQNHPATAGYTIIEVLLVMSLIAVLAGLATVNLLRPQATATSSATLEVLIADLRNQQIKSMSGYVGEGGTAEPHGIKFEEGHYVLFSGEEFNDSDQANFVVNAGAGVVFDTNFPGGVIVFQSPGGEVVDYQESASTVSVINNRTEESASIHLNSLGVVTLSE